MNKIPQEINKDEQDRMYALIPTVFSPGTPITKKQLFAGRREQMVQVLEAVYHASQHAIIFGERGIGKTSLASVISEFTSTADSFLCFRINCGSADTFDLVWKKMFSLIAIQASGDDGNRGIPKSITESLGGEQITPFVVQQQLTSLSKETRVVLIFDEFDTMRDPKAKHLFAETIKALSDFSVPTTIVLVGIADSVEKLIEEHRSIERNLSQVRMPRMSSEELGEILIANGLEKIGLGIDDDAHKRIIMLSQGLPNYAHSLGKNSAFAAVKDLKRNVSIDHVSLAVWKSLEQADHTIRNLYVTAVSCPRKNMLKEVLLACAIAPCDALGSFAAVDVREPLRLITGNNNYDIPSFAPHLKAFSSSRGPVLSKTGTKKNFRYRFTEPVLQPYIIMEGWRSGNLGKAFFESK